MLRSPKMYFLSRVTAKVVPGLMLFVGLTGGVAHGDTLIVNPERLELSATKPVANLQFQNTSAEETTLHFNVTLWRQDGVQERLTPTRKLIVLPEKMTLKPGEVGKVRVGLRLSGPWWEEEAFQILVTETPPIPDVGIDSGNFARGRIIRPSSVPVFLLPPGSANPRVTWSFERNSDGAVILRAANCGQRHVQLNSASLLGPSGQSLHKPNMSDTLLPGGERAWVLAPGASAGLWFLIADTSAGPMRAEFELEPDGSVARALTLSQ